MTLKPTSARWFELLTDRDALGAVLRVLASTSTVELEAHSSPERPVALPDYAATLADFAELARRYRPYWPPPLVDPAFPPPESIAGAEDALAEIRAWAIAAEPTLKDLQEATSARTNLAELSELLAAAEPVAPLLQLSRCTRLLSARLFALAEPLPPLPPGMLAVTFPGPHGNYVAALATDEDCLTLDRELAPRRARRLDLPAGLSLDPVAARESLDARIATLDARVGACRAALGELESRHHLAAHLAGFAFLEWLVANVPRLPATEHFAWVTGWTADRDGRQLDQALQRADLPHLLHYPEPPRDAIVPVVFANRAFLKPFELFVRLIGTPRAGEADPTVIVALLAPLLFGIMFGDLAQGLLLLGVGLLTWRRAPALRLLVPGGICAAAFGWAFGSVGAREDVIGPLWLHPLASPLTVLSASIAIGGTVISVGLLLDALTHVWRGEGRRWLLQRGGLVVAYLGLLACLVTTRAFAFVGLGVAWSIVGPMAANLRTAGATIGESIETLMQLLVNTISFARVGAFALAHAGLSAAIVGIAEATGHGIGFWIALILGNLLMVVVEGVVVGIQTTRLVLFEFFIRFLHADGRPLRPLAAPPGSGSP
jgi:V/A-type H+-transporting ATPase subunit I